MEKEERIFLNVSLALIAILLMLIFAQFLIEKEKRFFQNMTSEEIAQAKEIHYKLTTMSPGSLITLEEKSETFVPSTGTYIVSETYMVKRAEDSWASIIGPGPGSRINEQKTRIIYFSEVLRPLPFADLRVTAVHTRYVDEGWKTLMTWWALQ